MSHEVLPTEKEDATLLAHPHCAVEIISFSAGEGVNPDNLLILRAVCDECISRMEKKSCSYEKMDYTYDIHDHHDGLHEPGREK
jgi:hypothetical protein